MARTISSFGKTFSVGDRVRDWNGETGTVIGVEEHYDGGQPEGPLPALVIKPDPMPEPYITPSRVVTPWLHMYERSDR